MAFTYDLTTNRGKVRLLITDSDYQNPIFQDNEIDMFLSIAAENDIRLAAAEALETIARSEALVQKKIKLLDLTTDGPAVAKSLMESARLLRDEAANETDIDWIEVGLTTFNREEIIWNDALRTQ